MYVSMVRYHPQTELQSHYGEVIMGQCYDSIVYIDSTDALDISLPGVRERKRYARLEKEYVIRDNITPYEHSDLPFR